MSYRYHQPTDTTRGHDSLHGSYGPGLHDFLLDEIEFGARVAYALNDPEQAWWLLIGDDLLRKEVEADLSGWPDGWPPLDGEGE